jgi:hypothetical protein
MQPLELDRLNRILADTLGRNVHGEPIYKWIASRELTFPLRDKEKLVTRNGILVFEPHYVWEPQTTSECWVLAKWLAPPSHDEWLDSFGTEVAYPARGLYYVTDVMLSPEYEPNEAITYDSIGKVKALRSLTLSDIVRLQREKRDSIETAGDRRIADWIDDKATAFGNVPGKRGGHVSFGGS